LLPAAGVATDRPATDDQIRSMQDRLRHELDSGALGVGMGIEYTPGATRFEVIQMFRLAAERRVPVFVHIRSEAPRMQPDSGIESVDEVIGAAAISGASLHIVHVNSMCMKDSPVCLSMVAGARARGLDVTVEAYPYTAAMTYINSAAFNPGWREKNGIDYGDLQLPDSPERLTKEQFELLHASSRPQLVLMHLNPEELVDQIIRDPLVMIASDGAPGHPRNAGPSKNEPDAGAADGEVHGQRPRQRAPAGRRRCGRDRFRRSCRQGQRHLPGTDGPEHRNAVRDRQRHGLDRSRQIDDQHLSGEATLTLRGTGGHG
jgi:hypothetical protein